MSSSYTKDLQYYKFCLYGFFKNLRFFDIFLMLFFLDKGISFLEIGLLYSTREIIILLMEIPSGIISDAMGRRRTLIASFLVYILSFVSFYFSDGLGSFFIAMILFAFADAFRSGIHKSMIFQYLKINNWSNHKVDYYGHTRSWSQSGSAISSLIAASFVFYFEKYDVIFIASVIPYLVNMALIYSYPVYLDGEIVKLSGNKIMQKFDLVITATLHTMRHFSFFKTLTNLTLYTGYYKAVKDYIQPLLKYVALSIPFLTFLNNEKKIAVITGVIYFFLYILTAISSKYSGAFTGFFSKNNKPMNYTLLFGLLIGGITGLSYYIGLYILPIIGFVVIMVIENLRKPIGIGLIADISKDESMATTLSITSQAKSLIAAIVAPAIGWFADIYNPSMGIVIVSVILIIALPAYWLESEK